MTQSGHAKVDQSFNLLANGGNTKVDVGSQFLLSGANAAVDHVLELAHAVREHGLPTEGNTFENRVDYRSYHNRKNGDSGPVVSLPPLPKPAPPMSTLHALQEWEGRVVDIGTDELVARLVDLTAGSSHESEEATIPLAEISERDALGMAVGSIFRWVIGFERSPEGTRKRVSQIVFRDLPKMTESDLRDGREWARRVAAAFNP